MYAFKRVVRPLGSRSRAQLFQHLDALVGYHEKARLCIPRTAVLVCPLQHPEVPVPRRVCACLLVPRTAVSARPLQNIEVSLPRRTRARFLGPRVAVRTQPLQHLEMPVPRRTRITRSRTSGSRSHATTAAPIGVRPPPRAQTSMSCPGDLSVAGAAACSPAFAALAPSS